MAKSFKQQTDEIDQAIDRFMNGAKNRSVICIVANKSEWRSWVPIDKPDERFYRRQARKQNPET